MSQECDECGRQVEPVPLGFSVRGVTGWFLVCPTCHYVFEKHGPNDLLITPSDAPPSWVLVI